MDLEILPFRSLNIDKVSFCLCRWWGLPSFWLLFFWFWTLSLPDSHVWFGCKWRVLRQNPKFEEGCEESSWQELPRNKQSHQLPQHMDFPLHGKSRKDISLKQRLEESPELGKWARFDLLCQSSIGRQRLTWPGLCHYHFESFQAFPSLWIFVPSYLKFRDSINTYLVRKDCNMTAIVLVVILSGFFLFAGII